jgi:hypothetical protein
VVNINDVLEGHVGLEVDCVDRLYLNAYVPTLQVPGQVARFLHDHLGLMLPSPAAFEKIGNRFRGSVRRFAEDRDIPILRLKKPDRTRWDDRKLDHVRPYLQAAEDNGRYGVVAIVAAQEFQWVFSGRDSRGSGFTFFKEQRRVGVYYFYVLDPDFGAGFIKICTYFPVRHEAPLDRVGCKDPPVACRSRPLKLEAARPRRCVAGWEQPRQRRDGSAPPDGLGPASKTERCTSAETSGGTPSTGCAGSNLVDQGRSAVHAHRVAVGDSRQVWEAVPGGHGEGLRRSRGEAAGEELGTDPVDRSVVNVGTVVESPSCRPARPGSGKAHRLPMARRRGGGSVVVRGRESRPHGEGTQRDRSCGTGMPGGRR